MNKRFLIILGILTFAILLTACGGNAQDATNPTTADAAAQSPEASGEVPQGTFEPGNFEMPLATQLLVGTFMLEDTENAVNGEQAAELLPLWQVYRGLLESDTVATEEINALTDQIAETMTDAQMQAIEGMQISAQSMMELTQTLGVEEEFQRPDGAQGGDFQPPEGGFPEGGGFPGGGGDIPGGGGVPGGGGGGGFPGGGEDFGSDLTQEQMEALQATREAGGGLGGFGGAVGGLSTGLLDALIELLQGK